MRKAEIAFIGLVLLALCSPLLHAGEATLYQADWANAENNLPAGWTTTAKEWRTFAEPKLGAAFQFGSGLTQLRIPVPGGHQLRFRFRAVYRPAMDVFAQPYAGARGLDRIPLSGQKTFKQARPDPQDIDLGVFVPDAADSLVFAFKTDGQITLGTFAVMDFGAPRDYQPDGKELLTDPGWEEIPARTRIPAENSYGVQCNGWMGWMKDNVEVLMVTPAPSRVHTGKQAVFVSAAGGGLRQASDPKVKLGRCYDLSVWAKGQGNFVIYDVGHSGSPTFVVSTDEWRQFHYPVCLDNPAHPSLSMGILVQGRLCLDDFSVREITRSESATLVQAGRDTAAARPAKVVQTIPPGEKRSGDPVVLEDEQVRVVLSPKGGGRVTEFCDKQNPGAVWQDTALLGLTFPGQPVPVEWSLPFRTEVAADGRRVTFSHTATGGAAAPFLDGVHIEQEFTLEGRAVAARFRLTNRSSEARYPLTAMVSQWSAGSDVRQIAAAGEKGLMVARDAALPVRELTAGWTALCGERHSLLLGFHVQAVRAASLDPVRRSVTWNYLRTPLSSGGTWETTAFLTAVPLAGVDYADRNLAAQVRLAPVPLGNVQRDLRNHAREDAGAPERGRVPVEGSRPRGHNGTTAASGGRAGGAATPMSLELATAPLRQGITAEVRVMDYENRVLARAVAGQPAIEFVPPAGRFISCLDVSAGRETYTVELFNDPPERTAASGIQGAGMLQYAPTIPIRVLRFPDIGDQRFVIAASRKALWAYGLHSQYYPLTGPLTEAGLTPELLDGTGGFPEEVEELLAYRLVILSNLGAAQLSASSRASLSQYVRAGGALLVIGGSCGLGNARTRGTDLEEMLPAKLSGPFEVLPRRGDQMRFTLPSDWLGGAMAKLGLAERPSLFWAHQVTARPNAKILARIGLAPALVSGAYGRGRVALFAGTVEGEPKPGELPAWQWSGWTPFWRQTLAPLLAPAGR